MDRRSNNIQKVSTRTNASDKERYPYLRVDKQVIDDIQSRMDKTPGMAQAFGWKKNPVTAEEKARNNQIIADEIYSRSKLDILNFYNNAGYNSATNSGGRGNYLMPGIPAGTSVENMHVKLHKPTVRTDSTPNDEPIVYLWCELDESDGLHKLYIQADSNNATDLYLKALGITNVQPNPAGPAGGPFDADAGYFEGLRHNTYTTNPSLIGQTFLALQDNNDSPPKNVSPISFLLQEALNSQVDFNLALNFSYPGKQGLPNPKLPLIPKTKTVLHTDMVSFTAEVYVGDADNFEEAQPCIVARTTLLILFSFQFLSKIS